MQATSPTQEPRSVLASLRAQLPQRYATFTEALRVAETQANRLLALTGTDEGPVPSEVVSELPRIAVRFRDMPTSGLSFWNGQVWIIALNHYEPTTRQRFTLFHEYKHIIDHGSAALLYRGTALHDSATQAEQAADYFAGCALVPRKLLKRAWASGLQTVPALAYHFDVSTKAIEVRLAQTGLRDPVERCRRTSPQPRRAGQYFRQVTSRPPVPEMCP